MDAFRGNYLKEAPPHSFIDAQKFQSAKELASYLQFLNNNTKDYLSYFHWKKKYSITPYPIIVGKAFCHICRILNVLKI